MSFSIFKKNPQRKRGQQTQAREAKDERALLLPHTSEKTKDLSSQGQYVFFVERRVRKREVARQVQARYGVQVKEVRIMNMHPKKIRLGRIEGIKKRYKKAIVRVQEGQHIEISPS